MRKLRSRTLAVDEVYFQEGNRSVVIRFVPKNVDFHPLHFIYT